MCFVLLHSYCIYFENSIRSLKFHMEIEKKKKDCEITV